MSRPTPESALPGARIAPAPAQLPDYARFLPNLADSRLGGRVIACSDEFFGAAERLLNGHPAVFVPDLYDDCGKWMDGWETRRKRAAGHDWVIIQLAQPSRLYGVDIDTSHFNGNHPHAVALYGCLCDGTATLDSNWRELIAPSASRASDHHLFALDDPEPVNHVLLRIYPDGGVARLRVYGQIVHANDASSEATERLDLVSVLQGGRVVALSDAHFGRADHLLYPDRGLNMGDGWETRRRREPGNEWCIIALGQPGIISDIEIDTAHFKGNYPYQVSVQAAYLPDVPDAALPALSIYWPDLLSPQQVGPDQIHHFTPHALTDQPITHIRLNAIPDGGISRIRLWGNVA